MYVCCCSAVDTNVVLIWTNTKACTTRSHNFKGATRGLNSQSQRLLPCIPFIGTKPLDKVLCLSICCWCLESSFQIQFFAFLLGRPAEVTVSVLRCHRECMNQHSANSCHSTSLASTYIVMARHLTFPLLLSI